MTRLLDLYDESWASLDVATIAEMDAIMDELIALPKRRWSLKRMRLRANYKKLQTDLRYLRDAADQDTRDRLLREIALRDGEAKGDCVV